MRPAGAKQSGTAPRAFQAAEGRKPRDQTYGAQATRRAWGEDGRSPELSVFQADGPRHTAAGSQDEAPACSRVAGRPARSLCVLASWNAAGPRGPQRRPGPCPPRAQLSIKRLPTCSPRPHPGWAGLPPKKTGLEPRRHAVFLTD